MQSLVVLIASLALSLNSLTFCQDKETDQHQSILQQLEGKWQVLQGTNQGERMEVDSSHPPQVIFKANTVITLDPDEKELYKAKFELDTSSRPYRLDMVTDMPNLPQTTALGILSLQGDRLSLCYALPGNERPEKFESPAGSKLLMFEMAPATSTEAPAPTSPDQPTDNRQILVTFGNLSGASVLNALGESVGTVDEIVTSTDQKLTHVIITVGGIAGFAADTIAAPLQALSLQPTDDDERKSWLTLTAPVDSAPRLETPDRLELSDPDWLVKNGRHFDVQLQVPKPLRNVKISQLIDDEVFGIGGDSLACFDELIFQFGAGQPATPFAAILGYGGVLAVGKEYVAVDFDKLHLVVTEGDSEVRLTAELDVNRLQKLQKVTPSDYPELRLQTVLKKIAP